MHSETITDYLDEARQRHLKRKVAEAAEPLVITAHLDILELARFEMEKAKEVLHCRIALTYYMGASYKDIAKAANVPKATIAQAIADWEERDESMFEWLAEHDALTAWEESGKSIEEWMSSKITEAREQGWTDTKIAKSLGIAPSVVAVLPKSAGDPRPADEGLEALTTKFTETRNGEPFTSLEFREWLDDNNYTGRNDIGWLKRALLDAGCSYKPVVGKEGKRKRMYCPPTNVKP